MVKHLHKFEDALDLARNLEREGKPDQAEKAYLKLLKNNPAVFEAYNRLMVIYRKQKELRKELAIINQAIKAFNTSLLEHQKQWVAKNKVAARLSKSLALSLGVMDKKGLPVNDDPILIKWKKRKELVSKKLGK